MILLQQKLELHQVCRSKATVTNYSFYINLFTCYKIITVIITLSEIQLQLLS